MEVPQPGVMRVDTRIVLEIVASLERCPRCLRSHPELVLRQLQCPSPPHWDLWATCPATNEPMMFRLDPQQSELLRKAVAEVNQAQTTLEQILLEQRAQEDVGDHARSKE